MALTDVRPNSFFQFAESSWLRRLVPEQRFMDIPGRIVLVLQHFLCFAIHPLRVARDYLDVFAVGGHRLIILQTGTNRRKRLFSNRTFRALADPTRREILDLLRHGEMTAGALAEKFDMTKPSMSHHFAVLKEADLITSRRDGQQIWYALNTTVVQDVMAWAMRLVEDGRKNGSKRK